MECSEDKIFQILKVIQERIKGEQLKTVGITKLLRGVIIKRRKNEQELKTESKSFYLFCWICFLFLCIF